MPLDKQFAQRHIFPFKSSLWKSADLFECFLLDEEEKPISALPQMHVEVVVGCQS